MKTKFWLWTLISGLIVVHSVFGQGSDRSAVISTGAKHSVYRNAEYGFELTLPQEWHTASEDQVTKVRNAGNQELKEKYAMSERRVEESAKTENISLAITRKMLGQPRNPVIGLSLTSQPTSGVTAKMIADATKGIFVGKNDTSLEKDTTIETIAGHEFATLDLLIESTQGKQHLRMYVTVLKTQALTLALSYWDKDDLQTMEASLRSIRFDIR